MNLRKSQNHKHNTAFLSSQQIFIRHLLSVRPTLGADTGTGDTGVNKTSKFLLSWSSHCRGKETEANIHIYEEEFQMLKGAMKKIKWRVEEKSLGQRGDLVWMR